MRRRIGRMRSLSWAVMSWPSNTMRPAVGSSMRRMARPVVDLPQPLSPTSPSVSPRRSAKLTPSTAFTVADLALDDDPLGERESAP